MPPRYSAKTLRQIATALSENAEAPIPKDYSEYLRNELPIVLEQLGGLPRQLSTTEAELYHLSESRLDDIVQDLQIDTTKIFRWSDADKLRKVRIIMEHCKKNKASSELILRNAIYGSSCSVRQYRFLYKGTFPDILGAFNKTFKVNLVKIRTPRFVSDRVHLSHATLLPNDRFALTYAFTRKGPRILGTDYRPVRRVGKRYVHIVIDSKSGSARVQGNDTEANAAAKEFETDVKRSKLDVTFAKTIFNVGMFDRLKTALGAKRIKIHQNNPDEKMGGVKSLVILGSDEYEAGDLDGSPDLLKLQNQFGHFESCANDLGFVYGGEQFRIHVSISQSSIRFYNANTSSELIDHVFDNVNATIGLRK